MKITINKEKVIYGVENEYLLDVLRKNNIDIKNECGSKGNCGKCKIKILSKNYLQITSNDKKHLTEDELRKGIRLACKIKLHEDIEVELIENKDNIHVLTDIKQTETISETNIKKQFIQLEKPSIKDQRDDIKRLKEALNMKDLKIDIKYIQNISNILSNYNYKITVTTYNDKLIHIQGNDRSNHKYGIALDLGTTTIAMYLIDLNTGKIISVLSQVNKQRAYGSDVISRINYTMENLSGLDKLHNCIINQINSMIKEISKKNEINKNEIYNLVVVGNTTMIHLLIKVPCKNIALAPFIPTFTETVECNSTELGIDINGIISFPPSNSSYVGSDIIAGILSSNMSKSEKYSLLLDIGTNGEIALGNNKEIYTCATAAGPAFEGANIKYGIGGIDGAISSVDLNSDKIFNTINNVKPCGICGSGVLDITSELVKHEIVDETGKMCDLDEIENEKLKSRITTEENLKTFVLYEDDDKKISFTQKDVREVQLAKASICAGIQVLLKESNLTYDEIENVYIGGGFGNYMNIESAANINMIPLPLKDKIKSIGNCAGKGAIDYLINKSKRKETDDIINKCKYIELSKNKDFQEIYIDCISFD